MKTKNRKVKFEIEVPVKTYISDDGTVFELTDEEIVFAANNGVSRIIVQHDLNKEKSKNLDVIHEFVGFEPNIKILYDESNKKSYYNFVNKYLKDYYVDSNGSNHYHNGGNWQHFNYNPIDGLHNRMMNGKLGKNEGSVRELILMHLVSGGGVRMYGNPQSYKRVIDLETTEELKGFFRFILDSKMLSVNDKFIMPERFLEKNCNWWFLESCSKDYSSIAELLILECWRNNYNLEVVKWLVEEYGMDLHKVNQFRVCSSEDGFENSLLPHIFNELHDNRIHDTYNNGVLRRKYEYSKKKLSDKDFNSRWENKSFASLVDFIKYIIGEFPLLPILEVEDDQVKEYKSISDWLKNVVLVSELRSEYSGKCQSARELIKSFK